MSGKSTQIALGGMFSALCVVLMFMTGMVPFASYAIPALAGAMLIPVMEEIGPRTAVLVYSATSLLSVFIVPDREASMIFIVFFGYYPIAKRFLDRIRPGILRILSKLVLFNGAILLGYYVMLVVLGLPDLLEEMGDLGRYGAMGLLAVGNLVFVMYDILLVKYTVLYRRWFKPTFLRR